MSSLVNENEDCDRKRLKPTLVQMCLLSFSGWWTVYLYAEKNNVYMLMRILEFDSEVAVQAFARAFQEFVYPSLSKKKRNLNSASVLLMLTPGLPMMCYKNNTHIMHQACLKRDWELVKFMWNASLDNIMTLFAFTEKMDDDGKILSRSLPLFWLVNDSTFDYFMQQTDNLYTDQLFSNEVENAKFSMLFMIIHMCINLEFPSSRVILFLRKYNKMSLIDPDSKGKGLVKYFFTKNINLDGRYDDLLLYILRLQIKELRTRFPSSLVACQIADILEIFCNYTKDFKVDRVVSIPNPYDYLNHIGENILPVLPTGREIYSRLVRGYSTLEYLLYDDTPSFYSFNFDCSGMFVACDDSYLDDNGIFRKPDGTIAVAFYHCDIEKNLFWRDYFSMDDNGDFTDECGNYWEWYEFLCPEVSFIGDPDYKDYDEE